MVRPTGLQILLLYSLPLTVLSLTCYTCVYPGISPLDCVTFHMECSPEQRCLYNTATAVRGSSTIVFHEKFCASPSQCNLRGEKIIRGLRFNYTNKCCDTDLCNAADLSTATCWRVLALCAAVVFLMC